MNSWKTLLSHSLNWALAGKDAVTAKLSYTTKKGG